MGRIDLFYLFTVYLTTLSVLESVASDDWKILERICMEAVVTKFKVLSRHLSSGCEENYRNLMITVSGPRLDFGTSWVQSRNVNHFTGTWYCQSSLKLLVRQTNKCKINRLLTKFNVGTLCMWVWWKWPRTGTNGRLLWEVGEGWHNRVACGFTESSRLYWKNLTDVSPRISCL
jgi:hypothetical protein